MDLELDRWGRPARRRWLELILLIGFLLSLVVGIGAIALTFALGDVAETPQPADPLAALQADRIPPQYALLELAGDPPVALIRQAIDAGQTEVAYAQIAFSTKLSGSQRTGLLLLLARRMRDLGETERAAGVYGLARNHAVLSPILTPVEQAQALTECADGLLALGQNDAALDAADQARLVAAQAGDLLPVQRSQIFRSLSPIYRAAGADQRVQEVAELERSAGPVDPGIVLPDLWSTLAQPYVPGPNDGPLYAETQTLLDQVVAARQQTARLLVERIALTDGLDIEPERDALIQALINEDRVREEIFRLGRGAGPELAAQHWLLQERRAWLAQKVRIAAGGYGLRLVAEWADNPTLLLQDLGNTTADLQAILAAQANAQNEPVARAILRHQSLAWLALQIESGLFPGSAQAGLAGEIGAAILATQAEMVQLGYPLALPLSFTPAPPATGAEPSTGPAYAFTESR